MNGHQLFSHTFSLDFPRVTRLPAKNFYIPFLAYGFFKGRLAGMEQRKDIYSEDSMDIYTASLADQQPEEAVNTIMWRLAVALGYASEGDGLVAIDPDEVLELAEDVIWRYKELEK